MNPEYVHVFSLITVIGGITYFSIVIGELVPKSIAMNNAERIALIAVPIMKYFTLITYPFVRILSGSTQLILRLMGIKQNDADHVSEEELRFMLKNAGKQGVLETEESQVHQNLFYFTDQTAKSLLTHRSEMEWINSEDSLDEIFDLLKESVHSKFVVGEGSLDKVLGVITIKDFLSHYKRPDFRLADIISAPIFIIQNTPAFKILNLFKTKKQYIAIVVDEFGMTKGIITLHDLMEAIVGELPDEDEVEETYIIQRSENSYLIDGKTLIYELNQYFQREIIQDNIALYTTISGFILAQLKDLPKPGDQLTHDNYLFEIMDMDGVRIDKILMTRQEDGAL